MRFLVDLLTGDDNATYDMGRLLWAAGVAVYLWLSAYSVLHGETHAFDAQGFGIGFGAVLAAGGGMVAWTRKS